MPSLCFTKAAGCRRYRHDKHAEAKLAREAELPYATVAMVTDYDRWRETEKPVEVAAVLEIMRQNTEGARRLLGDVARLGSNAVAARGLRGFSILRS
ncbi:MAG: hypothetical protein R3C60_14580 [Parvularculaceae bacterium]